MQIDKQIEPEGRFPAKAYVTQYILQRIEDVKNDPSLLTRDRKNVNRVFYTLRKKFIDAGWRFDMEADPKQRRRSNTIACIKEVCDELGIKRSDIGIVTDNVGYLYFRGEQYSVGIDQIKELVKKGTDVVIVEKQDMALSLAPFAAPYGIALLSTRGFLTENAEDLQKLAKEGGAHIAILTDYDISGMVIAEKVPEVPRLGIDESTLIWLGLNDRKSELEEGYTPDYKHFKHVQDNPNGFEGFEDLDLDYLKHKRIELDSVIEQVGNETFWHWLAGRLEEEFPRRDYNRAVEFTAVENLRPDELQEFIELIDKMIVDIVTPDVKKRITELKDYEGFIEDLEEYESDMFDDFKEVLDDSVDYQDIIKNIKGLLKKYRDKEKTKTTSKSR